MECNKARDQFSSLLEKELNPEEEKIVREHLASCSECQKDFEQFDRTISWLHSVEEVEVPDGFLSGVSEKWKDRKRKTFEGKKVGFGWFNTPVSIKLPIQAVAMVAVVFLVIYITKIIPVETPQLKDVRQPEIPLSTEKKTDALQISKEEVKEVRTEKPSVESPRSKDVDLPKTPAPGEEKMGEVMVTKEKAALVAKPPQEIVLRISDREKVVSQLNELVKQFGGEVVTAEENFFLASMPANSISEFEKKVVGLTSSKKEDKMVLQKGAAKSLNALPEVKKREAEEKGKEPTTIIPEREAYITVRILLLQE